MREPIDKVIWGHVEKLGKGTRANYEPDKKTITFCFKRDEETSSEQLRKLREQLMNELKTAGLCQSHEIQRRSNCRKHRRTRCGSDQEKSSTLIRLNKKGSGDKEKDVSEQPT